MVTKSTVPEEGNHPGVAAAATVTAATVTAATATAGDAAVNEVTAVDAGLLARLAMIEDWPLDERASAFAELYAELQRTLEGRDRASAAQAEPLSAEPRHSGPTQTVKEENV